MSFMNHYKDVRSVFKNNYALESISENNISIESVGFDKVKNFILSLFKKVKEGFYKVLGMMSKGAKFIIGKIKSLFKSKAQIEDDNIAESIDKYIKEHKNNVQGVFTTKGIIDLKGFKENVINNINAVLEEREKFSVVFLPLATVDPPKGFYGFINFSDNNKFDFENNNLLTIAHSLTKNKSNYVNSFKHLLETFESVSESIDDDNDSIRKRLDDYEKRIKANLEQYKNHGISDFANIEEFSDYINLNDNLSKVNALSRLWSLVYVSLNNAYKLINFVYKDHVNSNRGSIHISDPKKSKENKEKAINRVNEFIKSGDIRMVRSYLMSVLNNLRMLMSDGLEVVKHTENKVPDLWEKYDPDSTVWLKPINKNKSEWNDRLMALERGYLNRNYAKERYMNLIEIRNYLYPHLA